MNADIDLVTEVKGGNKGAFSELVRRHQKSIYRLALRFTRDHDLAEDVVQESFVKAFEKINSFEGRSSFKSWVFRIAINTAKNKIRTPLSHGTQVNIEDQDIGVDSRIAETYEFQEMESIVKDEVDKLPERQRLALSLRVFEELSFQEIAEIMECPYDTAKANYRHAILKLRGTLSRLGFSEELSVLNKKTEITV